MRPLRIHGDEGVHAVATSSTLKFPPIIIRFRSTLGASCGRRPPNGNILWTFVPSAVLRNHLNHDRKYLPAKISLVDNAGRRGADAAQQEAVILVLKQEDALQKQPLR